MMALPLPKVVADTGPGGGLVTAMGGMNALAHNMLKRKYYAPDMESQINNRNALTEGQKIANQYMPDKLQLANAFAQLQNENYVPNIQSEINSRNALTRKTNTMTPLEAKELALKNEWYPKSEQATINWKNSGGAGMGVAQKELKGFEQQLIQEHPEWTPEQANQAASAYISGENSLPDGSPLPPISGLAQTYVDNIVKRGTTAAGINQQRFAATTDKLLDEGAKLIPSVAKYAGALGKAKGKLDSVASSLGADSPDYANYLKFTRITAPTAAGEMMRALGVNASDKQKEIYMSIMDPAFWDSNPKTAMENYKYMQKMFKETISKTVAKSTGEIRSSLRGHQNNTNTSTADEDSANKFDAANYDIPEGYVGLVKDGEQYFFPKKLVNKKLSEGYSYE